jgi:hypothetical protein
VFRSDGHGVGIVDGGVSVGSPTRATGGLPVRGSGSAELVEALELVCFDPAAGADERGRRQDHQDHGFKPSRSWFMARCQTVRSRTEYPWFKRASVEAMLGPERRG